MFDDNLIHGFDVAREVKDDALAFRRLFQSEAPAGVEEVTCSPFLPGAIKLVLINNDRKLTLFFFGDRRFVFGQSLVRCNTKLRTGECPLGPNHQTERKQLFDWLAGGPFVDGFPDVEDD